MAKLTTEELAAFIIDRLDSPPESSLAKVINAFWIGMCMQETDPDLAKRVRDVIFTQPDYKGLLVGQLDQWLASLRGMTDLGEEDAND